MKINKRGRGGQGPDGAIQPGRERSGVEEQFPVLFSVPGVYLIFSSSVTVSNVTLPTISRLLGLTLSTVSWGVWWNTLL